MRTVYDKSNISNRIIQLTLIGLAIILLSFMISINVHGEETGSISMIYPYEDVTFSIYKMAERDENGEIALLDCYKDQPIIPLSEDTTKEFADTWKEYIRKEKEAAISKYQSVQDKKTNSNSEVVFDQLPKGIYLIIGDTKTIDDAKTIPSPILVELPMVVNGEFQYHVDVEAKYEVYPIEKIELSVLKVWQNVETQEHPDKITVQLLKDGLVEEERELSAACDWRYTWKELDHRFDWSVVEKEVPDGYRVSIQKTDTIITLVNSKEEVPPGGETPPGGHTPPGSRLPQTGQLWWPVFVMSSLGLFSILIGLLIRREEQCK